MDFHIERAQLMSRILNTKSSSVTDKPSSSNSFQDHVNKANLSQSKNTDSANSLAAKDKIQNSDYIRKDKVLLFKEKVSQSAYMQTIDYNKLSEVLMKSVLKKDDVS